MDTWESSRMKNRPKVAVLIAHSYGEPFESLLTEIQPEIWRELKNEGVDVFYTIGTRPNIFQIVLDLISCKARYSKNFWVIQRLMDRFSLAPKNSCLPNVTRHENILKVDFPEGHRYMGVKIIASLKFLYNQGYEIIHRTTLSTVVINQNFRQAILGIPQDVPYYGGTKISFIKPEFVSGANLFLNNLAIKYLLENVQRWHHWDLDDVAIGKILKGRIEISELDSINVVDTDGANGLDFSDLKKAIHIRCKSNSKPRNDSEIMLEVLSGLEKSRGNPG